MFKVQDEADAEPGDFEVINQLAAVLFGDSLDGFGIHDYLAEHDQVRHPLCIHPCPFAVLVSDVSIKQKRPELSSSRRRRPSTFFGMNGHWRG
jgi:hypothetical protein